MALTIRKSPEEYVLSGNPIVIIVSSNTSGVTNKKIHVRIYTYITASSGDLIGEEASSVINNYSTFDISDYCKIQFKANFNIYDLFDVSIKSGIPSKEKFLYEVFETYNNDGIEHNKTLKYSFIAVQGGFSTLFLNYYNANLKTYLNNFIKEEKRFFTWSPNKKITFKQHDLLYFLIPISYLDESLIIRARFTIFFSDDSSTVYETATTYVSNTFKYKFYSIATSILAHRLDSYETALKKITHYEVVILSSEDIELTETKTYYVDRNVYNYSRQFIFRNSLGGYDIINLKGLSEHNNEIQRTVGYFQTKNDISFSEFSETFKANSGFIVNSYKSVDDARRYIIELFNSREIYEIVGKEIIPIIPSDKKLNIKNDGDFLHSFTFNYEYAYSDVFFAPLDTDQYLDPRIFYSNGIVTPDPVNAGLTAAVDYDVVINETGPIDFEINWGSDVGITYLLAEAMVNGVPKSLQSQIVVPGNVSGIRTVTITDNKGGRYIIDYNVGDLSLLYETGETILFEDGEQFLLENI